MKKTTEEYYGDLGDGGLAISVINRKYLQPGEVGPMDMWVRIAEALASVEKPNVRERVNAELLWALKDFKFIPGGRIMHAAGTKNKASLTNCYVLAIQDDSIQAIYSTLTNEAITYKSGGGVGHDLSNLRPRGATISSTGGESCGPVGFMNLFSENTNTISQHGRRGANMQTLRVDHPDIEEFITVKQDNARTKVQYSNISVLITDEFMKAVEDNSDFPLRFKGTVYKTINARELWKKITTAAHGSAEPGIIFWDRMKQYHNVEYDSPLISTNPCVVGNSRLSTQYGMIPILELYDSQVDIKATVDKRTLTSEFSEFGTEVRPTTNAFKTSANADVWKVTTKAGYSLTGTAWHDFYTDRGKLKLSDLKIGDKALIQSAKGQFGTQGSADLGMILGLLTGDGHITHKGNGYYAAVIELWGDDRQFADKVAVVVNTMISGKAENGRNYKVKPVAVSSRNKVGISSVILARILDAEYGVNADTKLKVPEVIWRGTEETVIEYLRGLFQADGTVNVSGKSNTCSVRLASSHEPLLIDVQMLLSNFGVFCSIYKRRSSGMRLLPDGKGGNKEYQCKANYEIIIDGESRDRFMKEIGFLGKAKIVKYNTWARGKALRKRQPFASEIISIEKAGKESVYDVTQSDHNSVIFNGLVTGQCGEQPLPDGGNCNLGSINLAQMVKPNGTPGKYGVDDATIIKTTRIAIRGMDNVIDYNLDRHALPVQRENAERQRRIGFGITGLADMLVKLQIPYDSEEALSVVERVIELIRNTAYETSVALAKEKGAFPAFDWNGYNKSQYVKKLPQTLRSDIKAHGIRNGTLLTIAPVGTGSIIAAVSSGMEPIFDVKYIRRVRRDDESGFDEFTAWHPLAYNLFGQRKLGVPAYVREAHQIDPHFRVRMQAVLQKYVDSSISSTVNLPNDATVETVAAIYEFAYSQGLKGITVYREGSRDGILISANAESAPTQKAIHPYISGELITPVGRPQVVEGPTEEIETGEGSMLVTINHDTDGKLVEVIARVGKAGGNDAAQSEAIGRLSSVIARSGVDPRVIVKQLKGIQATPMWHTFPGEERATQILSTPDGIAKALERYLDREHLPSSTRVSNQPVLAPEVVNDSSYAICPECKDVSLINEGGCEHCVNPSCLYERCSG